MMAIRSASRRFNVKVAGSNPATTVQQQLPSLGYLLSSATHFLKNCVHYFFINKESRETEKDFFEDAQSINDVNHDTVA